MTLERTASICFCIVLTSAIATGQSQSESEAGGVMPLRRVLTQSESGGRTVVVETVESLDINGGLALIQEIVTETTRTGPNTAQSRRDVFGFEDRRRTLSETTESQQHIGSDGDTSAVRHTWAPDLNGHLRLTSRQIKQTTFSAPDVRQTSATLLLPNLNDTLGATERTEHTEHRINPEAVRHESTRLVRDTNGRWQPTEIRRGEVRTIGPLERMEEETIQRPDVNGKLAVTETNVVRYSKANEQDQVVIETYTPYTDGLRGADGRPPLSQRVHRTTTPTADGGRYTVEELEARSPVAPTDPMRLIRRTVTTVRPIGVDRWVTERQVFERDVNGQLVFVGND